MKISQFFESLSPPERSFLSIIEKGSFYILLREDAFFFAKKFSFKLTKLDRVSIKVGFPKTSKNKWLTKLREENISYKVYKKSWNTFIQDEIFSGKLQNFSYDIEDYLLTSTRILEKNITKKDEKIKNFLLKDKLEELFHLLQEILLRLPKKERYFLREKIERNFLELLEKVYQYMYQKELREQLSQKFMWEILVLREFTRFLNMTGKIRNENIYLDLWERWIEICKIVKGLQK